MGLSSIITIDNVPDGYKLGKVRRSIRDQWMDGSDILEICVELNKIAPPQPPDGYEHNKPGGEYRLPKEGELFLCEGRADKAKSDFKCAQCWILRKTWQPPSWIPKGCWLFKNPANDWYVTDDKPRPSPVPNKFYGNFTVSVGVLGRLHGETFVAPTHTNCLQIQ